MAYKRFIGPNNGNWNTASSWSPSGIPNVGDEVVFESSKTIKGNPPTVLNLIIMPSVALTISTSTTGASMSIRGNLTNNGKLSTNTSATINFSGSDAPAYIYSKDGPYGFNFSFNKDGQTIYLDSNVNLYTSTTAVWTSSQGVLSYNAGNWQMNGRTFQARRLSMGGGFKGWYLNGNLILRNATTNGEYAILSSPATLYENTGRITLDTIKGTGSYQYALNQLSNSYENAINFTITGPAGTKPIAPNAAAHYKNLIVGNASLGSGTWNIHDSFTTSAAQTSVQSNTIINFYVNNGQTAIFNSQQPWTRVEFLQYSGSSGIHDIQRCQATTGNLNTNNITYYLNHSAGTGQTFNCSSSSSTYYIKVTGSASATINCNGNSSTYYLGWNNNPFSQTCGAYTLNCGATGSNSIFNYDNITDNIGAPCSIFAGAARGSTIVGGGTHNIHSGTNIAGSFNFNGGVLNITGDSPVVGSFNSCTAANNTNARTINWNGRYVRVNNQARNLNINGTGSINIYAANINTINSDMGLGDNYDGGIQMESSGLIQVGLWNAATCPRLKLVALGTGQSSRAFGSSYIRSIEMYGAVYASGSGARFVNPTARITWNEIGTNADFRQFYPQLASSSGGSFTYGNTSSSTNNQYKLGALITDTTLCGDYQTWDIDKAHVQVLYLTKNSGTWNLNDIIIGGNAKCIPDVTSLNNVIFNWNNVVKSQTTSNFTGYSNGDNFLLGGGVNCTHNINTNSTVNIASNNLECISTNVPGGVGATTNIAAPILGTGSILVSSYSVVKIINNISLLNIDIKPNGYSTGTLQADSDFTITGSLYNTPASSGNTAKVLFTNRTITFTGTTPINITRPLATGSDLTNSNMIIRSTGDNRVIRLSDNTTIWGTITNACPFVHTGSGNGVGWLEIRAGSDTGQAPTINNIVNENTTVNRGFKFVKPSGAGAKFTVNNANGMSGGGYRTVSYIQGDIYATYNPTLSWLGIKNSNVSTIVNTNWLADNSIDYGSNTGWTIVEPPREYPSYVGFFRFF